MEALGATGELSTTDDYAVSQAWSAEIHANAGMFDGFLYVSKHCNDQHCVVLFDRARPKLMAVSCAPLMDHPDIHQVLQDFRVEVDDYLAGYGTHYRLPPPKISK